MSRRGLVMSPRNGNTPAISEEIQRRQREIGSILGAARQQQQRTVTDCATILGTSRRRYTAIERGEAIIGAVELEILAEYLHIDPGLLWHNLGSSEQARKVVVQASPGEDLQIVIRVAALVED
jgi:transcriptional regulator with XRE-family HTH domain